MQHCSSTFMGTKPSFLVQHDDQNQSGNSCINVTFNITSVKYYHWLRIQHLGESLKPADERLSGAHGFLKWLTPFSNLILKVYGCLFCLLAVVHQLVFFSLLIKMSIKPFDPHKNSLLLPDGDTNNSDYYYFYCCMSVVAVKMQRVSEEREK